MSPEERLKRILRYLAGEDQLPSWMHQQSGWAQSGTLTTCRNDSVVKCYVDKFDRAAMYTVQIDINLGDAQGIVPFQTQAYIFWSINGTPVRRVIDVSQGASISGVTESARVEVYDVTPDIGRGVRFRDYTVLINVAPGPRAATTNPPFLRAWASTQQLLAGASTVLIVPDDVGANGFRLSVFSPSGGVSGATVTMADSNGTVYDQYVVLPGVTDKFVPLAPGTCQIVVTNNDGANPLNVSGQWSIDG